MEDIIFIIRKDPKKYARVKELLTMSEELRQARKAFDESMLVKAGGGSGGGSGSGGGGGGGASKPAATAATASTGKDVKKDT